MPTRTAVLLTVGACATSAALNFGVRTMPKRLSPSPAMGLFGRTAPVPEPLPEPEPETNSLGDLAQDVAIAVLRLGTCSLMYHHGIDKIQNVDGFSANVVAKFFGFLPGPPQFYTYAAAVTQVAGSGLLAVGVLSRPVAASMLATMAVAVVFHLLNTGPEGFPFAVVKQHSYNYELAAMYVAVLGYFTAAGAGRLSVDELVLGGELEFYGKKWNEVTGKADIDSE